MQRCQKLVKNGEDDERKKKMMAEMFVFREGDRTRGKKKKMLKRDEQDERE